MPVSHLEVAQGAEAWWDLSQAVVVKMDLTEFGGGDKASIFYKFDLIKTQSESANMAKQSLIITISE